jgi:hypothetical protein
MRAEAPHPLLAKVIPAAEALIREKHFSIENLCHAADCGLRELGEAVGTVDDVIAHVNDRSLWLDHALAHPQNMDLLMMHRWQPSFQRPDWYLARVNACFAPMEARLAKLAPHAAPAAVAGAARSLYAHICGLYFLSSNERAKPAGIESIRQLLQLTVTLLARGLAA